MTLREALVVFHELARGSAERQALALQILCVLDRVSLEALTSVRLPFHRCPAMVDGGRCAGLDGHEGGHYAHARDRH